MLRLHIQVDLTSVTSSSKSSCRFLISTLHLSRLICLIRSLQSPYKITLHIEKGETLKRQKAILKSLRRLCIEGCDDKEYAKQLKDVGTGLASVRELASEIFEAVIFMKRMGDEAFRSGRWKTAWIKYYTARGILVSTDPNKGWSLAFLLQHDEDYASFVKHNWESLLFNEALAQVNGGAWHEVFQTGIDVHTNLNGSPLVRSRL